MTTIVTRAGKGSPLTHTEVDTNFTNLNTNKLETAAIPLGTLAAPSISFVGDANTGAYSPGADTLAFVTAGSNRVHITSGGLVGIGTSSPTSKLDVRGSAADFDGLRVLNTDSSSGTQTSSAIRLGITNSIGIRNCRIQATELNTDSNSVHLDFYTNDANAVDSETIKMRLTGGGLLGIGTTSPLKELQINATTPTIRLEENGGGSKRLELSVNSSAEAKVFAEQSGSQLLFGTVGTERARIDSSGRLLVGTSTDQGNSILQVQGEAGAATAAGVLYLRRGLNTAAIGANVGADLGKIQWGANDGTIGAWIQCLSDATWSSTSDTPSALVFSTTADGAASPTERMRIDKAGNTSCFASTANVLGAHSNQAAATTYYLFYGANNATDTITGTTCFLVYTNGNVQNTNNSYAGISDIKLKENIVDATSQWSDLRALQVRKYNFKEGQTHTQIGLIAQEVELVSPGLVIESPDRDAEGNDLGTVTKSVNYSVLYMKAVKALQEAMERIETLEQRLTAAGID